MNQPTYILGGYQTDFATAWSRQGLDISDMMREATLGAISAAGLDASAIESIHVGNAFGELQRQQAHLGAMVAQVVPELWGVPAMRHEGACASSSLAILAAMAEIEAGRNPRDAKVMLAKEITARFHSEAAADAAEADFNNRAKGGIPDEIEEATHALEGGAPIGIAALLKALNLADSNGAANRLIDGGGVRVDSEVVADKGLKLIAGTYVVQVGKRKFVRVALA